MRTRDVTPTVAKNSWWLEDCPKHGNTPHLAVIDGKCSECQKEELLKQEDQPK